MTDAVWQIERKRRTLGLSASKLAQLAGINRSHYSDIVARKKEPRSGTVAALKLALSRYERGSSNSDPELVYRLCLLHVCQVESQNLPEVLAQDPARRATFDPVWMRAADVRGKALYIAHNLCGLSQKQLAEVAGVSPAAVSLAMGRVEDSCDPDADPLFKLVETAIGGF